MQAQAGDYCALECESPVEFNSRIAYERFGIGLHVSYLQGYQKPNSCVMPLGR